MIVEQKKKFGYFLIWRFDLQLLYLYDVYIKGFIFITYSVAHKIINPFTHLFIQSIIYSLDLPGNFILGWIVAGIP